MKKAFFIVLLASTSSWAGQHRSAFSGGWAPNLITNGAATTVENTAAIWTCGVILPSVNETLSSVSLFISATAGTIVSTDALVDVYSDSNTSVGSLLQSNNLGSNMTSAAWNVWPMAATPVSAGNQYLLCLKNVDTTPATNNFTVKYISGWSLPSTMGSIAGKGPWGRQSTVNSGATFSASGVGYSMRVCYTDGNCDGLPISAVGLGTDASHERVYGSTETGVVCTSPPNAQMDLAGVSFFLQNNSILTQTGPLEYGFYLGTSTTAVSYTAPFSTTSVSASAFSNYLAGYFSPVQSIPPNTVFRITIAEPGNSDTNASYFTSQFAQWDTSSQSEALMPFEGSCHETAKTTSNWVDQPGRITPFNLILDSTGEFSPVVPTITITPGTGQIIVK